MSFSPDLENSSMPFPRVRVKLSCKWDDTDEFVCRGPISAHLLLKSRVATFVLNEWHMYSSGVSVHAIVVQGLVCHLSSWCLTSLKTYKLAGIWRKEGWLCCGNSIGSWLVWFMVWGITGWFISCLDWQHVYILLFACRVIRVSFVS